MNRTRIDVSLTQTHGAARWFYLMNLFLCVCVGAFVHFGTDLAPYSPSLPVSPPHPLLTETSGHFLVPRRRQITPQNPLFPEEVLFLCTQPGDQDLNGYAEFSHCSGFRCGI